MKKMLLFISFILISVTSVSMAITPYVPADQKTSTTLNASVTRFALPGIVTSYQSSNSIIVINNTEFILNGKGELNDRELSVGTRIKYNIEKSSQEEKWHVTKIWLDSESGK